jgi:hypothetical protein
MRPKDKQWLLSFIFFKILTFANDTTKHCIIQAIQKSLNKAISSNYNTAYSKGLVQSMMLASRCPQPIMLYAAACNSAVSTQQRAVIYSLQNFKVFNFSKLDF